MILVIGGSQQGKLKWAMQNFGYMPEQVLNGCDLVLQPEQPLPVAGFQVLNHLEGLLGNALKQGWQSGELLALQTSLLQLPEDFVVICNSVGGGLVPIERFDREWRELVGRTCCALAAESSEVWRIFCGLPQRLK